nr:MAG TPA: hypothetical protein [Caudoviricetes sp.]
MILSLAFLLLVIVLVIAFLEQVILIEQIK